MPQDIDASSRFQDCLPVTSDEMIAMLENWGIDYTRADHVPLRTVEDSKIDINVPIGCGDAPVFPGDIVVGDDDSVIIIPAEMADDVAAEAYEMTAYEDFVVEQVRAGKTIIGLYPATPEENLTLFAEWRAKNGR